MNHPTQDQTPSISAAPVVPWRTGYSSPAHLLAIATATVFVVEILVMLFLSVWPPLPPLAVALLDAVLVTSLVLPIFNIYLLRPMTQHIAQRNRAERALRESSELLEKLFSTTHIAVALMDRDFNFIRVNRAYAEADGRPPEFYTGKNHFALFPNAENEVTFRSVVATGQPYFVYEKPFEYAEHPERGVTYWDWSLLPLTDAAGRVTGVLLSLIDVTTRKRAEQARVESERRFRAIFDQSFQFIGLLQPDGTVLEANQTSLDIGGLAYPDVVGRPVWDTPWPGLALDAQARLKAAVARSARGEFVRYEDEVPGANGARLTIDFSLKPVKDDGGQVVLLIAEGRDISGRKQAERALQKAHDDLELRVQERTAELQAALETSRQRQAEVTALLAASRAVLQYREFEKSARSIYDVCKDLLGASAGYITLVKDDVNEVIFLDAGGYPCSVDPDLPMPIRGLREQAYRTGRAIYENDFSHSRWTQFLPDGHADLANVLFAPLVVQGFVVGLLGLANKPGGFNENDARMASAFGEIAALAFLNIRTVELLETSEERFRSVAQTASEAMITLDVRGNIVFWNRAAETIFGYSADVVVGKPLTFIMPERFRERHQQGMTRLASTGQPSLMGKTVELVGLRRDDCEFPVELSLSTWQTREGVFFTGIIRDITERKRAQEAAAWLASFPELNPHPVVEVDLAGRIHYLNPAARRLWPDLLSAGSQHPWLANLELGGSRFQTEGANIISHEVTLGGASYQQTLFYVAANERIRIYGLDITQRKRAEEALRKARDELEGRVEERTQELATANEELRAEIAERRRVAEQLHLQTTAVEAAANGIVITDRHGDIRWANPAFTHMTGYATSEVLGQNLRFLKSGNHAPDLYRQLWKTIASGQVWRGEMLNRRKDGSLYTEEQTITPVVDENGEVSHFIAIKQDITERKRVELQLERNNQELRALSGAERVQRQLAEGLVQSILALNSTLDLDQVLKRLLEQIQYVIPYRAADIDLIEGDRVRVAGQRGFQDLPEAGDLLNLGLSLDEFPLLRRMSESRQPCLVADTQSDPDWRLVSGLEWVRSYASAPLQVGQRVIGFINLNSDQPGFFDQEAAERLVAFAAHAATAIHNARLYEAEQQARRVAETLRAASLALTQTLDLDTVLDTLLEFLSRLVPYDSANVILLETESRLAVRAARGYDRPGGPERMRGITFDAQANPLFQQLLFTHQSHLIPDTHWSPVWEPRPGMEHVRNWIGVPLVAADRVIGACALDKAEAGFFTQEHVQLAEALVGQAAVAVQNAWLFEQVRTGHERLQELSRRLVEVQESERRYIARELHDEAGQALTTLMVGLRLLERNVNRPEVVISDVTELKRMVEGVLENLHRLAIDLRPASLDHLGLVAALREYAEAVSDRHGLMVQFEAVGLDERLPPEIEITLYRIVQEALTNVVRHAQATRVDVLLEQHGGKVIALVEDNGAGFDPTAPRGGRLGLLGIQERAEMLGGRMVVESAAAAGTTVFVEVPYALAHTARG